ncbi:MAG: hypothetical protein CMJ77_14475 [Planctomycetaceae bacterium]|nr:hypothetical protein [Planctomycetaceae bacterium]
MTSAVMILGAGIYQVPLIRTAKAMGLRTIVASTPGNYPGIQEADLFLPIDTTDQIAIRSAATEQGIRAIVTTGTDVSVPSMGLVNDSLRLSGVSHQAAVHCADKTLMKDTLRSNNINTAAYLYTDNANDGLDFANSIGFPVIIKPIDSSGSRGVTRVCTANEFELAWNAAIAVSRTNVILVEEYLTGTEFGAQAFVVGNQMQRLFLHSDTVTPPPVSTPIGHAMPYTLSAAETEKLEMMTEAAVDVLGIRDSICNVDYMLVDSEPYILEIAARMGATCIPENITTYAGFDTYEYLLSLTMGDKPSLPPLDKMPCQANAALLMRSSTTGVVRDIIVPESLKKRDDIVSIQIDIKPGQGVKRFSVGPDRIGHVVVKQPTAEEAELACVDICESIDFVIDENA